MGRNRRKKIGVKSLPEKEVEVVPDDDVTKKIKMIYCKPITLYDFLETRSQDNPSFLPRCLSYKIEAKKKKTKSCGTVYFNYMDCNNVFLRYEVVKDFSCPFCSEKCGGPEAMKLHLTSSHDIFEYNFWPSGKAEIDVSLKPDAFRSGELSAGLEKHQSIPFTFSSKRRKRSERDDRKKMKRPNVQFLEMDLNDSPRDTENELVSHVHDDNLSSPAKAHSFLKTSDIIPTITQPEIGQFSEPKVPLVNDDSLSSPAKAHSSLKTSDIQTFTRLEIGQCTEPKVPLPSRRKMLAAERSKAKSIERFKKREFYHSKTYQPMSFEQIMADADSETEVDDEYADIEERMRLNQLVKVGDEEKRFMFLWNSFVRKQRVIASGHLSWACEEFTKLHEQELISSDQSFWGWWRLFMIKLWKHGLVCGKTINKCNTFLQNSQEAAAAVAAATSMKG